MNNLDWYWVYVSYLDVSDAQEDSALKAGYNKVVFKDSVDKLITELEDKIRQKDFFWEGCGFSKMGFENTIDVANYVAKLKEATRLAEMAKDDAEAANTEYREDIKQLKRALWLARAKWAMAEAYSVLNDVITSNKWTKVLNKCQAKAKEY